MSWFEYNKQWNVLHQEILPTHPPTYILIHSLHGAESLRSQFFFLNIYS
jgi:hypothetical protein